LGNLYNILHIRIIVWLVCLCFAQSNVSNLLLGEEFVTIEGSKKEVYDGKENKEQYEIQIDHNFLEFLEDFDLLNLSNIFIWDSYFDSFMCKACADIDEYISSCDYNWIQVLVLMQKCSKLS